MELDSLIAALSRPEAYARPAQKIEVLQTHVSVLFFAGDRVYKLKKPVDMGFLDYSTLALREHYCREEVRLNRRLTARVHLGVVPIVRRPDGGLRMGGAGEPVEWAVEMVRLDARRMLDALLDAGEADNEKIDALAELLVDFHQRAATGAGVDEHGRPEAVRALVLGNLQELERFVGAPEGAAESAPVTLSSGTHRFLAERARAFLDRNAELLARRMRAGRVRDGHGDLHAGNICFGSEGIDIYDCIEFSARFRCSDVACDLAFLAMDLDFRGFAGFGGYLAHRYAELARDEELNALLRFYKGYRATVRGKVASLTAADAGIDGARREHALVQARRYFQLAAAYELPPALILMCGLPATGKSLLARAIARPFHAVLLQSDVRRKILAGLRPDARAGEEYGAGLYADSSKEATYESLLEMAQQALEKQRTVIVDATFSRAQWRAPFLALAAAARVPCYVAHVRAPERVVLERLAERARDRAAVSDADAEVSRRLARDFEEPDELPRERRIELRGDGSLEEAVERVVDAMVAAAKGGAGGR